MATKMIELPTYILDQWLGDGCPRPGGAEQSPRLPFDAHIVGVEFDPKKRGCVRLVVESREFPAGGIAAPQSP